MSRTDLDDLYLLVAELTTRHVDHQWSSTGLIPELQDIAGRTLTRSGQNNAEGKKQKPGSRPPSGSSIPALDLLADIEARVWQHDADLRDQLDAHLDYERTWTVALNALPGLVSRLPDPTEHPLSADVHRDLSQWRRSAKIFLQHLAPMVKLNIPCRYCAEQSLIVRADASSSVVCTTDGCEDERGDRPRWTRETWVLLLTEQPEAS